MSQPSAVLTREQVRRIDRLAVERFGMRGILLMENAGRGAAEIIDRRYGPRRSVIIVCGTGNNGGDGFVIARHLHNTGWKVQTILAGCVGRLAADAGLNYGIVRAMGLPIRCHDGVESLLNAAGGISAEDVVVDALLGIGFQGEIRSPLGELIEALNVAARRALVAVDVPSGLDCDTGKPANPAVRADLTITFVAWKLGFLEPAAAPFLGEVEIAGIGAPKELIEAVCSEPAC